MDSKVIFDTFIALHESLDYRMQQTVQRIRENFALEEFDALVWIHVTVNVSDALKAEVLNFRKIITK